MRASEGQRTKTAGEDRRVPSTVSELEVIPISQKGSVEGKSKDGNKIVDRPVVDVDGMTSPLARDVVERAPSAMGSERVDAMQNIGLEECLGAERFGVLPVKDRHSRLNPMGLIWVTAYGAYIQKKCSWGRCSGGT